MNEGSEKIDQMKNLVSKTKEVKTNNDNDDMNMKQKKKFFPFSLALHRALLLCCYIAVNN